MKVGTSVVTEVTLYKVQIHNWGRGSVRSLDCYFETKDTAIAASTANGRSRVPEPVTALQLSDGSYILEPICLNIGVHPSVEVMRK